MFKCFMPCGINVLTVAIRSRSGIRLIDTVMEYTESIPSPYSTVFFEWMGGAIAERAHDAAAFPHCDRSFAFTVGPKWIDPERDDEHIRWAREFHQALEPYAADGDPSYQTAPVSWMAYPLSSVQHVFERRLSSIWLRNSRSIRVSVSRYTAW